MINKSLKKNAILNVIKTACTIFFPLITFPYISRILLPEGIGKVNFANSIVSYFGIISSLGISSYATREASKVRDNKLELSKFVKEILILNICSSALAYTLLFISLIFIPKFTEYRILICICSSTLLLSTLGIDWFYSALEEFKYITIRSITFQIISLILLFSLVHNKEDYLKYAAISVISSAGSNILNLIHSRHYINIFNKSKISILKHIKPILILFVSSIAINIFTSLDTSMLGFLSDNAQVGYYSAASKIIRMIRDLFPAVFTVLFARLSFYVSNDDTSSLEDLTTKTLNLIFFFSLPMFTGINILMPSIVNLLCGKEFLSSITTARILSLLLIISSYSGFLGGQLLIALNKEKIYMWCMITASLTDVALNYIFIPLYGANGAAFATIITEIFIFFLYTFLLRSLLVHINIKKNLFQYLLSTIIMTLLVLLLNGLIKNDICKIIICSISGFFIYIILLYLIKNSFILQIFNIINDKFHFLKKN